MLFCTVWDAASPMWLPVKCILLNYICAYIAVQVLFLMRTQALSLHVLLVGKKHIILNTYYIILWQQRCFHRNPVTSAFVTCWKSSFCFLHGAEIHSAWGSLSPCVLCYMEPLQSSWRDLLPYSRQRIVVSGLCTLCSLQLEITLLFLTILNEMSISQCKEMFKKSYR